MQDDFEESVSRINGLLNGLLWYGLPDGTGLWQPVDADYAAFLKSLIAIEHRKWLHFENNAKRWFGNEDPYNVKERRILIRQ